MTPNKLENIHDTKVEIDGDEVTVSYIDVSTNTTHTENDINRGSITLPGSFYNLENRIRQNPKDHTIKVTFGETTYIFNDSNVYTVERTVEENKSTSTTYKWTSTDLNISR